MPDEIQRLIQTYDFLDSALADCRHRLAPQLMEGFQRQREDVFLEILGHKSSEPRVTLSQLRFLLNHLLELRETPHTNETISKLVGQHLDDLAEALQQRPQPRYEFPPHNYHHLNSLTDRIAVLGRDYCYRFTNQANADFHDEAANDFDGRPSWLITGEYFFENVNKPRFDQCFAGHHISYVSPHPGGDPAKLYLVNIDPVQSHGKDVQAIMISCRDVSHLPIPPDLIIPTTPASER